MDNPNQYIENMVDGATAGYRYFNFTGAGKISVDVRGTATGALIVRDGRGGEVVARIPVAPCNAWTTFTAPLSIGPGKKALYFTYEGAGSMDFMRFAFGDPLSFKTTVQALLEQMTFEEKASLLTGAGSMLTAGVERLGVPTRFLSDGPHGVRIKGVNDAVHFPNFCCAGASIDVDMLRRYGNAIADESANESTDQSADGSTDKGTGEHLGFTSGIWRI